MRYYVTINDVSSLTIPGLAIKSLPSISKTLMRNQKETIDGRNGDLITELGYSAYDKTLTIGLFGNYDINQIIAFFNQKGTIVFSDEPDKYYKFSILEQIDFAKLVKFRTANVRIHCQPFKYEVNETPVVIEAQFIEGTGTNLTLNNTTEAPLKLELLPDTQQDSTTGKNLFDTGALSTMTDGDITFTPYYKNGQLQYINVNGTATANAFYQLKKITLPAGTYILNGCTGGNTNTYQLAVSFTSIGRQSAVDGDKTFTISQETTMNESFIRIQNGTIVNNVKIYPMIRLSSVSDSTYEPYTNGVAPNPEFPMPIEVVTGNQNIKVQNKNLCYQTELGGTANIKFYFNKNISQTITLSATLNEATQGNSIYLILDGTSAGFVASLTGDANTRASKTITFSDTNYKLIKNSTTCYLQLYKPGASFTLPTDAMIENGSTATTYVEHQEQNYTLTLGTLEYCKIGDYSDRIFKNVVGDTDYDSSRELGKWYIKHNIKKTTNVENLITSTAVASSDNKRYALVPKSQIGINNGSGSTEYNKMLCNKFSEYSGSGSREVGNFANASNVQNTMFIVDTQYDTVAKIKEAYPNITTYGAGGTPTYELLNNTLQEQLNALENAMSYETQTNIVSSGDLAIIVSASAYKSGTNEATINNTGNIYAKPTIELEGSGTIGVYFGNTQLLSVNMISDVTIDSENMEAYDPDTLQSRNRQVTGSYENIKFEPGNTNIKFSGKITKATIRNWKRWL